MEQDNQVATEQADDRAAGKGGTTGRRSLLLFGGVAAAGLILGGTLTGLLHGGGDISGGVLDAVPPDGIAQIRSTLSPANAATLIDDAQRCHEPLARVAIMQSAGTAGGVISILSGSYRSPPFALTPTPTLVGLPFPAPYQVGQGVLVVEGSANGLVIALTPQRFLNVAGSAVIPVRWTPVSNCR
jgi:hypothetical protein